MDNDLLETSAIYLQEKVGQRCCCSSSNLDVTYLESRTKYLVETEDNTETVIIIQNNTQDAINLARI